jgi:hypothetical protein
MGKGINDTYIARVARGSKYVVNCLAEFGYGPGYAARRKTRSGSGDDTLGRAATLEQAKDLCERHHAQRRGPV